MQTTDIKKTTFWGRWSSLTKNEMPETTCGLGWHMIFSLLSFPLWVFPGLPINGIIKLFNKFNDVLTYYYYIIINIIIIFIGVVYHGSLKTEFTSISSLLFQLYWAGLWIGCSVVIGIVLIVLIFGGIIEGSKWLWGKISEPIPEDKTISHLYYSLKDKHCSRINWK